MATLGVSRAQTVTFTASEIAHLKHSKGLLHGIRSKQREKSIEEASNDGSSGRSTPQEKIVPGSSEKSRGGSIREEVDPDEVARKHLEGLHGQSFDDDVFKGPDNKQSDA